MNLNCLAGCLLALTTAFPPCFAQESPTAVEKVADRVRDSIVVVTTADRDGDESEMGTGFVVDSRGLIATSLHVIGEGREIWVQTTDGTRIPVTEVHASDRNYDLAILRVQTEKDLPSLKLGVVTLKKGQPVVAVGHPLGLKHSVVSGVVAGERSFGINNMYQVAMAIEPGNSGGPLMDLDGGVHGVVALKYAGDQSFGFAVKVAQLRKLLDKPNPIAMEQWRTIGRLDSRRWKPVMGARWRQRGGRIIVQSPGQGFGGRSLLLRMAEQLKLPFEVAVSVKLDDESGAAGLIFHCDGKNKHYGFYPSAGSLRLTNFDGPSIFSWTVLRQEQVDDYKPGEWNELKVRVENEKITAFVNNQLAYSIDSVDQPLGQIGLCKFRDTKAQFKHFRFGKTVTSNVTNKAKWTELARELQSIGPRATLSDQDMSEYSTEVDARLGLLENQAREMERKAKEFRSLASDIHLAAVCDELHKLTDQESDKEIDILRGALLIAKLDNRELDVESYIDVVQALAQDVKSRIKDEDNDNQRLVKLNQFLFNELGFHGSRADYYESANSHMDRVIDDREGLPITLSVLYISIARRLGLNVVGVGMPGHFVARHEPKDGKATLIDVFDRGTELTRNKANLMVFRIAGRKPTEDHFASAKHKDILLRILTNLQALAQSADDIEAARRYVEAMTAIDTEDMNLLGSRAILRHQVGRTQAALDDLDKVIGSETDEARKATLTQIREQLSN